jgi:hypothetical protein
MCDGSLIVAVSLLKRSPTIIPKQTPSANVPLGGAAMNIMGAM